MSWASRLLRKLLNIFLLLNLLVCPFTFVGMVFIPLVISFMEPVVCPDGMQMETVSERQSDREGTYTLIKVVCVSGNQEVDITWKVFLIMFGFPALGVIVVLIAPSPTDEKEVITLSPGGK